MKNKSSHNLILLPRVTLHSFLLHVTFIPRHPEYTMIPTAFIFLPTILCDYYYADFVYSNYNKLVFSMMPDSMCFVSKCINSTERIMVILCYTCIVQIVFKRVFTKYYILWYFYIFVQYYLLEETKNSLCKILVKCHK